MRLRAVEKDDEHWDTDVGIPGRDIQNWQWTAIVVWGEHTME
jgi:hypothetical protein